MDIDHFKKYNDQNGHPMGDTLLKMYSQILKKTSRKNDIVARIGGEEFVIMLPHTDKMGAAIKAEKLRRIIEATPFPHGEKQPLGKVSSSFGVAEYPSHSHDAEGLVKAADDALYQVKSTTRNRVCLATVAEDFKPDFEPLKIPAFEKKST
jgi:diguanylate cyclase (GGDEF)-like protein